MSVLVETLVGLTPISRTPASPQVRFSSQPGHLGMAVGQRQLYCYPST